MTDDTLIQRFKFTSFLNTNDAGRRIILQGTIDDRPALLLAERLAFSTDQDHLTAFTTQLTQIETLGQNDIYNWYLANTSPSTTTHSLKINLIYPSTPKHMQKYSPQRLRLVHETPEIYTRYIRPYMRLCRDEGRLNWVFNILSGAAERENVLYRTSPPVSDHANGGEGRLEERDESEGVDDYILLPDLNWDRRTLGSLHLLALPQRRDIWSLRDLRVKHLPWLRRLKAELTGTIGRLYEGVDADELKFYVHYQPTYYHFHIHVVHVGLDAGATQAVGKAVGLEVLVGLLEGMKGDGERGLDTVELSYTVGEESELWKRIWLPMKEGREPDVSGGGKGK